MEKQVPADEYMWKTVTEYEKRKVIIDCDPGVDDAVMLALAAAHREELEILGITTVSGNQDIKK